jgi:protein-disulfide isomerase
MLTDDREPIHLRRRAVLGIVGGALSTGCLGGGETTDTVRIENHPATVDIESAPMIGPPPEDAEITIVGFSDPSCPQCADFSKHTLPELKKRYIDPGRMSYIWRALPSVAEWADEAVAILLAVHEQHSATFWWLKRRFHESRSEITTENVVDKAIAWLADRNDVDPGTVRQAVGDQRFDSHLAADQQAADGSGVEAVPSFVLFRDGQLVTVVVGPHSPTLFEAALDL